MWKLEFWKLEIKFGNWKIGKLEFLKLEIKFGNRNFEELFKDEILKNKNKNKIIIIIIIIMKIMMIK